LQFEIDEQEISNHSYNHHRSLSRPVYQNQLLLLGDMEDSTRSLMPYICHLHENRTKTFEPFNINTSIENFMKDFGYGEPNNTLILKGKLITTEERNSIAFCEERGYEIKECIDFQDTIEAMFSSLSDEIDIGSARRRSDLQAKLSRIRSSCGPDLQLKGSINV